MVTFAVAEPFTHGFAPLWNLHTTAWHWRFSRLFIINFRSILLKSLRVHFSSFMEFGVHVSDLLLMMTEINTERFAFVAFERVRNLLALRGYLRGSKC